MSKSRHMGGYSETRGSGKILSARDGSTGAGNGGRGIRYKGGGIS